MEEDAGVAQLAEQRTLNPKIGGSIPLAGTTRIFYVSYYSYEEGPGGRGITRWGYDVGSGMAACDPAYREYVLELAGVRYLCGDTGGRVHGDHIDVWVEFDAEGWELLAKLGNWAPVTFIGRAQ